MLFKEFPKYFVSQNIHFWLEKEPVAPMKWEIRAMMNDQMNPNDFLHFLNQHAPSADPTATVGTLFSEVHADWILPDKFADAENLARDERERVEHLFNLHANPESPISEAFKEFERFRKNWLRFIKYYFIKELSTQHFLIDEMKLPHQFFVAVSRGGEYSRHVLSRMHADLPDALRSRLQQVLQMYASTQKPRVKNGKKIKKAYTDWREIFEGKRPFGVNKLKEIFQLLSPEEQTQLIHCFRETMYWQIVDEEGKLFYLKKSLSIQEKNGVLLFDDGRRRFLAKKVDGVYQMPSDMTPYLPSLAPFFIWTLDQSAYQRKWELKSLPQDQEFPFEGVPDSLLGLLTLVAIDQSIQLPKPQVMKLEGSQQHQSMGPAQLPVLVLFLLQKQNFLQQSKLLAELEKAVEIPVR